LTIFAELLVGYVLFELLYRVRINTRKRQFVE